MGDRLKAPFPWAGGKGRWCDDINARLGADCSTYNEPFAGSLAVLLSRAPAQREVVCDTSGLLVNCWRSIVHDPQAVAYWGDWPTLHDCLIARRRWLGAWVREHSAKLQEDPDYYDAKAGGWWAWAMSHSIRGNADMGLTSRPAVPRMAGQSTGAGSLAAQRGGNDVPHMYGDKQTGQGIQTHRKGARGGVPFMANKDVGSQGIAAQRGVPAPQNRGYGDGIAATKGVDGRRPGLGSPFSGGQGLQAHKHDGRQPHLNTVRSSPGRGVSVHRKAGGAAGAQPTSERWGPWMDALCARLKQVVVLNRPWRSACTPAALASRAGGVVAVLLDPPYITAGRSKLYEADGDADEVNRTAQESYEWALKHGGEFRIAYCHTAGSFEFPADWEIQTKKYTGTNRDERTQDAVAYSPRCLRPGRERGQQELF